MRTMYKTRVGPPGCVGFTEARSTPWQGSLAAKNIACSIIARGGGSGASGFAQLLV